jgi:hypothetical protein
MRKFNRNITIQVSVDLIAKNLLEQFKDDFKHKELVVETIVGRALNTDVNMLSFISNTLNGYDITIDFQVGDIVAPDDLFIYGHWGGVGEKESRQQIKSATVVGINLYADSKLQLEFEVPGYDGSMKLEKQWYAHTRCAKLAELDVPNS